MPGGRQNRVKVVLTDGELAAVRARAGTLGVSVPRLLLESALAGDAVTVAERRSLTAELMAMRHQLHGLGVNVNQLARVANATGVVPAGIEGVVTRIAAVTHRLDAAVTALAARQARPRRKTPE